jgi:hypothetical protein
MFSTTPTVKNFANHYGYSDVNPYEIVRRVSDRTIEVRRMDTTIDPSWKRDFIPGGFFGHTANNDSQKWIIVSNPANEVIRIRLTKSGWRNKGMRFQLADKPVHFYDFNF